MKRVGFANVIFFILELLLVFSIWFTELWFEDGTLKGSVLVFAIILTVLIVLDIMKDICTLTTGITLSKEETGEYIWKDRKRNGLGLPWSFTRYRLTKEKLIVDKGFFSRTESEVRLYRVVDLCVERSFMQRTCGMGTITVHSSDKSDSTLVLKNIKRPLEVKEKISKYVEIERQNKRISGREIIDGNHDIDDCECGEENY